MLVEEAKHIPLPGRHVSIDQVVSLASRRADRGIDLENTLFAQTFHLGGQRLPGFGRVIVPRVDEHHGRSGSVDGRVQSRAQLGRLSPAERRRSECHRRAERRVSSGDEEREGSAKGVAGDGRARAIDVGKRPEKGETGSGLVELLVLQ